MIEIKEIKSLDELFEIERKVREMVISMDTLLCRTFLEVDYDNKANLLISDMAGMMILAKLPIKEIKNNKGLQEHIDRKYLNTENWDHWWYIDERSTE